jgi:hypothetical protein
VQNRWLAEPDEEDDERDEDDEEEAASDTRAGNHREVHSYLCSRLDLPIHLMMNFAATLNTLK